MRNLRIVPSSFLSALSSLEESENVIVGCPLDLTVTSRPGVRFAPQAIREASWGLESYSPRLDSDLEEMRVCDLGDLELPIGDGLLALKEIEEAVRGIVSGGKVPFLMGGEHLITLAGVKGLLDLQPDLVVLQLDAHADLRDEYLGVRLSHATVMRRVGELVGDRLVQVGIRSGIREEWEWGKKRGTFHAGRTVDEELLAKLEGKPVYLTVDLDILDPSVAPGVSTPEPGGWSFDELMDFLYGLRDLKVVAFDLVELTPPYDPTGQSAAAAAKILREGILLFGRRNAKG